MASFIIFSVIIWAFVLALHSFFSVPFNNFVVEHLHLVIAWFSFFSVTIKNFVLDHLHLVVMSLFRFLSGPIKNFVLLHLYPVVMTLFAFFFTYFSFQIKSFLWDYLKPQLQIFVQFVGSKLKAPTTAAPLQSVQLMSFTPIEFGRKEFEERVEKAVNFLKDDSQGVLGIWGMGGVGKTTLLEHINNTLEKNSSSLGLDKVVFVTASKESTTENIQTELAKKLGMPQGVDQTGIFNYLSNKSFAILLDDVWERQDLEVVGVQLPVDLKKVGVPLPFGVAGEQKLKRKLILTTRSRHVCIKMGARTARQTINVECLRTGDARLLFRDNAGVDATVISDNPLIEELADRVADECGGLPIALITTGRALAGDQTVPVWEHALESLEKSKFSQIPGMDDPLPLLKVSYDHLKDPREKECLLHCALWPEDYSIPRKDLIQCWMGHDLLGKFDSINEAYNTGHAIIDSLLKVCLLENVKVLDEYALKNQHVKLHDVIRDMALWIARDCGTNDNKWKVLAGQGLQEAQQDEVSWREAHKISLMYNYIKSLPSNIQSTTPDLTTLMLQGNMSLVDGGLSLSKYFNSLKYLDISGCYSLKCFPTEICGLTKLEYLNISNTRIRSLPEELKALVNMKYLIAQDVPLRSRIPPELLSNLVSLIELDLVGSCGEDFISSVFDNLDCLKGRLKGLGINVRTVSNLQKLVQLPGGIPITSLWLDRMEGLDSSLELLSRDFLGSQHIRSNLMELALFECESVEEVVIEGKHQLNIETLYLSWTRRLKEIKWKGVEPRDVLPKIRLLSVNRCPALRSIEWVMYLPCLELLILDDCNEMEQMFGEEAGAAGTKQEEEDRPTFPSLRKLTLSNMPKLSSICHRPLTFPSLEFLDITNCKQLKKLPFHSPSSCTKLREIRCDGETCKGIDLKDNMQDTLKRLLKI